MTLRRSSVLYPFLLAAAFFAIAPFKVAHANENAGKVPPVATTVDRLVAEAATAKTDGNMALAYALLHDVVNIAPENAQARWQLGQVKVQDEWLAIEEAERRAASDPQQANYRKRKDNLSDSPQDQAELARWCRKNDLDDEARVHWIAVLRTDPNNKQALRALGKQWRDGQLVSPQDIKATRLSASSAKRSLHEWEAIVSRWTRALSDKNEQPPVEVLEEIRAVDDVAAIPAVERVTLNPMLKANEKNPAAHRLNTAFVTALRDMADESATNSLVRHAVLSPFSDIRSESIAELRFRPLTDFVPNLLDSLAGPIKTFYRVQTEADGSVNYVHEAYREGPFADFAYRSSRSIRRPNSVFGVLANTNAAPTPSNVVLNATNAPVRAVSAAGALRSALRYEQEIVAGEKNVQAYNQQAAAQNERIVAVLRGVSDESFGDSPREWWDWWQEYTDYYRESERPVYATVEQSSEYIMSPIERRAECFVAGTPVWTKTGPRPIDSLSIGDLVLAQDVNTGEIGYRPITFRTLRPAGPTLEMSIGGETIRATRGHPFWVDGVGWRMARELEDDALLHTVAGATRVESIKGGTEAETYNLVVADFSTYFVGESGILVHDNTPRRPTQAVVPGLARSRSE